MNKDSGYHGSQSDDGTIADDLSHPAQSFKGRHPLTDFVAYDTGDEDAQNNLQTENDERRTTEGSFNTAQEEMVPPAVQQELDADPEHLSPALEQSDPQQSLSTRNEQSPMDGGFGDPRIPQQRVPVEPTVVIAPARNTDLPAPEAPTPAGTDFGDINSQGSSPIRPIVRKASLNFASLPAREPIITKQSIGNRVSRTSHLDQNRTSYYGRPTGSKSLGNSQHDRNQNPEGNDDELDDVDMDAVERPALAREESVTTKAHNKTSTQRLQDQISMLGKSQSTAPRPSKSIPNIASQASYPSIGQEVHESQSPGQRDRSMMAPGAFPDDEDDDWIGPPTMPTAALSVFSPRPMLTKSHSTDVMEGVSGKDSIGGADFNSVKHSHYAAKLESPLKEEFNTARLASTPGHSKSASTSVLESPVHPLVGTMHKKGMSVSNPNLSSAAENGDNIISPHKSPTRSFRDSPLKASKDKFSSILKLSKGLFASSAAVSAEAKTATLSPATSRIAPPPLSSSLNGASQAHLDEPPLYPNLHEPLLDKAVLAVPGSPIRIPLTRKTRASTERDEKMREREAREAREMADQLDRLEKVREAEREKARIFSLEQAKVAAMEKQLAAQKEQERLVKAGQQDPPRTIRSSPRKTNAQLEAEGRAAARIHSESRERDTDMTDVAGSMPPPSIPRAVGASQIGKPKELKRPLKPAKEAALRSKQAPMVIRVDTGSQRNQFLPSNTALAASLQDSLTPAPVQTGLRNKASSASLQTKSSAGSFKSSVSSTTGKPKALEAAARKKEQVRCLASLIHLAY